MLHEIPLNIMKYSFDANEYSYVINAQFYYFTIKKLMQYIDLYEIKRKSYKHLHLRLRSLHRSIDPHITLSSESVDDITFHVTPRKHFFKIVQ